MKEIKLYSRKYSEMFTLIDDEDFEVVGQYRLNPIWDEKAKTFYVYGRIPGKGASKRTRIKLHRIIMGVQFGMDIDHVDHNGLNNQRSNLRICTHSQNIINGRKQIRKTSSKFKGVHWNKQNKRWRAQTMLNQKHVHIGLFRSEIRAAKEYDKKAIELFGGFALTNKMLGLYKIRDETIS